MTPARAYSSHPIAALMMVRFPWSRTDLTWNALEEFAGDLDRLDAEDAWQAELLNAVEEER